MNYFSYFSSCWNIVHDDIYHQKELYFRRERPILYFTSCIFCVALFWFQIFNFTLKGKRPSISFYSEALFEAYWYCVCTIRSNCGTVRDSRTANRRRPELRRVLKVLDIAPRRAVGRTAPWSRSAERLLDKRSRIPRSMRILITRQPTPSDLSPATFTLRSASLI